MTGKKVPKQLNWILVSENQSPARPDSSSESGDHVSGNISTPPIKNHTATLFDDKLFIFGGYDGKKNHCDLRVFNTETDQWQRSVKPEGKQP